MPGAYRPQTTWLCVKRPLVISGSIILPCMANTAFVALEMSLHRNSTWSWLFRHGEDMLLAGIVTVGEIRQTQGRTEVVVNSGKGTCYGSF